MKILLWLLYIIFISILNSTNLDADLTVDCFRLGAACNPTSAIPCCGKSHSCQKKPRNVFLCAEKVTLSQICKNNEDCDEILHSKCSHNQKCACQSNYVQLNDTHCAPSIGEFCWKNEKCAAENAVCIESECRCKPSFIKRSNLQCVAARLGETCENNEDCKNIRFAECSERKTCRCILNFMELNFTACAPLLGSSCSKDDECSAVNSFCSNNYCQCKDGYFEKSDDRCEFPYFATLVCQNDRDCNAIVKYTTCTTKNNCACKENYIALNDSKCAAINLNEHCRRDSDCALDSSWCIKNKCKCIYGLDRFNTSCQEKLGKSCRNDHDCKTIRNSVCSYEHNLCVCDGEDFAFDEFGCAAIFGGFCTSNEHCRFGSSHCVDNKCKCLPGFAAVSVTQSMREQSLYSCETDLDCGDPWHTKCSEDKLCICNSNNTVSTYPTCLPELDGYCWRDDQCITANSRCFDYNCECKPNYVAAAKNLCVYGKKIMGKFTIQPL